MPRTQGGHQNAAGRIQVVGRATPVHGDHRQTGRHGLQHHRTTAFANAGQDKAVLVLELLRGVALRHPASEVHARSRFTMGRQDAQGQGLLLELGQQRAVADDEQRHGLLAAGLGKGFQQQVHPLDVHQPAHEHITRGARQRRRQPGLARLPELQVDAVFDHVLHTGAVSGRERHTGALVGHKDEFGLELARGEHVQPVREPAQTAQEDACEDGIGRFESRWEVHAAVQRAHDHRCPQVVQQRRFLGRNRHGLVNHVERQCLDQLADLPALAELREQPRDIPRGQVIDAVGQAATDPPQHAVREPLFHVDHMVGVRAALKFLPHAVVREKPGVHAPPAQVSVVMHRQGRLAAVPARRMFGHDENAQRGVLGLRRHGGWVGRRQRVRGRSGDLTDHRFFEVPCAVFRTRERGKRRTTCAGVDFQSCWGW